MKRIVDVFDLPNADELTALAYVIRLRDNLEPAEKQQLVEQYVFTPAVREAMPALLAAMHHVWQKGGKQDLGEFIHGSFGSGKSHFMSYLGLLLEDDEAAWSKKAWIDALAAHGAKRKAEGKEAPDVRSFVREARVLPVRLNMLSAGTEGGRFDRAIYRGLNNALRARGKAPFEYLNVQGILEEARREAASYGAQFWKQMQEKEVVGSSEAFERLAKGTPEERERLARGYLEYRGRDPESAGIDPNWAEGLQRVAKHVHALGYKGVAFLVDELLLWLSEKQKEEFRRAINQLNVVVDHEDVRELPVFVLVARQRNLKEFFPDFVQDDELYEHIEHHSKRFDVTELKDVELRHICKERVLRRKDPAAVEAAIASLVVEHEKILPTVLQGADVSYLKDVYPFHPALIEALIDISSLMQRERTALRLLYELLVVHHPNLEVGKLLPVGRAFEAIFPPGGVDGLRKAADLKAVHGLYYQRFRPTMEAMLKHQEDGFDEARRAVLDDLIKTALLAELSPRLKGAGALTIERLVYLNDAVVPGEMDRGRMANARRDLVTLSRHVPSSLQVSGTDPRTTTVTIVLHGAGFAEVLERARPKVSHPNARFKPFLELLEDELGLSLPQTKPEDRLEVRWRGTKRRGTVVVANVRELANKAFLPSEGDEFRVIIDYPWDEPGYDVEQDRARARAVKKSEGSAYTVCWLPRHFTPYELEILRDYAAAEYVKGAKDDDELLRNLPAADRKQIREQAIPHAKTLGDTVRDLLRKVYKDDGSIEPLVGDVDTQIPYPELKKDLDAFAQALLSRHWAGHPDLGMEPGVDALRRLCDFCVDSATQQASIEFTTELVPVLKYLGYPDKLDIVEPGQTKARYKSDGRYMREIAARASSASVPWAGIDEHLEKTYGFQGPLRSFFLALLARTQSFRIVETLSRATVEPTVESKMKANLTLVRAPLLDVVKWSNVRALGQGLVGGEKPASTATLAVQDRYRDDLRAKAEAARTRLSELNEQLVGLGVLSGKRVDEVRDAIARLAPLVANELDSYEAFEQFLKAWPDDGSDPVRAAVQRSPETLQGVSAIDRGARSLLLHAIEHPSLSAEVKATLDGLSELLAAGTLSRPLGPKEAADWNRRAAELAKRLVAAPLPPVPPFEPPVPPPLPPADYKLVQRSATDEASLDAVLARVKAEARKLGPQVELYVTVRKVD